MNNEFEVIDLGFKKMKKTPPFIEYELWEQLKNRVIVINEDISDFLIDEVAMYIIKWNEEDNFKSDGKPIQIYLNTDGGDITAAMGIIGTMNTSTTPIHVHVIGKAYSAGALLLINGHYRTAFRESSVLIHDGTLGIMNSSSKSMDFMMFQNKIDNLIKDMFMRKTKITSEMYEQKKREEWYLTAEECLELGIIDEIKGVK